MKTLHKLLHTGINPSHWKLRPPLDPVAQYGRVDVLQVLLKYGFDPDNSNTYQKNIDRIPFIQNSDNALSFVENKRNPDGSIPTIGDVAKKSSLGATPLHTPALDVSMTKLEEVMYDPCTMKLVSSNLYGTHKKFPSMNIS